MIRPKMILGVARAESRLTRRLARYWVFLVLSLLLMALGYAYYALIHYWASGYSATVASINPRYVVGFIGFYAISLFLFGLVFLGFDVRARDVRERMFEVVDSLPCTNLELVLGRYVGIMRPSWIPMVLICIAIIIAAMIVGNPIEPLSLVNFAVSMAVPAFTFLIGLTFLISLLVRHRGIAAVVMLVAVVGVLAANFLSPTWLSPLTDISGAFTVPFPSDLTKTLLDTESTIQRFGVFVAGIGLLVLAAGVHPRLDGSRTKLLGAGAAILVVGFGMLTYIVVGRLNMQAQTEEWKQIHSQAAEQEAPDMLAMAVDASIKPGKRIDMQVDMTVRAAGENALSEGMFTLNPGFEIETIADGSGQALDFTHEDGLVRVNWTALQPGQTRDLRWEFSGDPNNLFAYLDSARSVWEIKTMDGNIFLLGYDTMIFKRGNVSLMPGGYWLPKSGTAVPAEGADVRPVDFFDFEIEVEVPEGWLVAGPAKRVEVDAKSADGERFRFDPPNPLPEVALVAGPYASRTVDVDGITAEIMVTPAHVGNLEFMSDASGEIRRWLSEKLEEAKEIGLDYPFDSVTLVEVPNSLRGYGGGWRMDSVFAPPAMALMRESTFPTADFGRFFKNEADFADREGGMARAKLETLERFFENDFSGGNIFTGIAKNFFSYQTAGRGPVALPLDYVFENVSAKLTTDKSGYFSAFLYDRNLGQYINPALTQYLSGQDRRRGGFADTFIEMISSSVSVWDQVLTVALAEIDPWEDPRKTINVLTLKGNQMARSLVDRLGREKTGQFLSALRERARGRTYDRDDVLAAGREVGVELDEWLELWLARTELPGYTVRNVEYVRAEDDENGSPRYALKFVLQNEESVPGLFKVRYSVAQNEPAAELDPMSVEARSAMEIGIVVSQPFRWVAIDPYLSLNRAEFDVDLPNLEQDEIADIEPFDGSRVVDYRADENPWLLVDDLSDGFSVVEEGQSKTRLGANVATQELDGGIPVRQPGTPFKEWSRDSRPAAYGKYRHTFAITPKGKGNRQAVFAAEIPKAGNWELEYHLPMTVRSRFNITVEDASGGKHDVTFDAENANAGWNALGNFEIAAGEARVIVSDKTDGRRVVADAIRWIPPKSRSTEG